MALLRIIFLEFSYFGRLYQNRVLDISAIELSSGMVFNNTVVLNNPSTSIFIVEINNKEGALMVREKIFLKKIKNIDLFIFYDSFSSTNQAFSAARFSAPLIEKS